MKLKFYVNGAVYNNNRKERLGDIIWRKDWKCHIWSQDLWIDMSADCLQQVISKLKEMDNAKKLADKA